jgi:Transposase IS4
MLITLYDGRPQNIDFELHWYLLRLFKLFFNWDIMALIVKETNSYAFRNNKASNLWKSLSITELYYFFSCLIKLSLYKHPSRFYLWSFNGILS